MDDRHGGSRIAVDNLYSGLQLAGERLDNAGAQPDPGAHRLGLTNAIVAHR